MPSKRRAAERSRRRLLRRRRALIRQPRSRGANRLWQWSASEKIPVVFRELLEGGGRLGVVCQLQTTHRPVVVVFRFLRREWALPGRYKPPYASVPLHGLVVVQYRARSGVLSSAPMLSAPIRRLRAHPAEAAPTRPPQEWVVPHQARAELGPQGLGSEAKHGSW